MSGFQNVVAYAVGPKGSGKTAALWELFIQRHPRRLSIDLNGEMVELRDELVSKGMLDNASNPTVVQVFSLEELRRALRVAAGYSRWHIALCIPPAAVGDVAPELARILNPTKASEEHQSFSKAVGSIAVDCSEASKLIPNGRAHRDMLGLFQTGRHNWLHLLMASQTPAKVDPECRNAADFFLAFRTQETTVWKYWADVASGAIADVVSELPRFHCAYFVKAEQRVYVLDDKRRPYRVLDYQGREIGARAAAPDPSLNEPGRHRPARSARVATE